MVIVVVDIWSVTGLTVIDSSKMSMTPGNSVGPKRSKVFIIDEEGGVGIYETAGKDHIVQNAQLCILHVRN